jgi:tetratricopeptide (TPR) repeat protein
VKFIKPSLLKLLLLMLVAALVFSGCSSSPEKKTKAKKSDEAVELAEAGSSILPPGPALPNPYLQTKASVSRQAAQQFAEATRAMRNKQWAQAESLLQKVVAENNKLSGAYVNLGLVYRAQGDDEKAEQAFNQAITANPNNLDAYNSLAILKREKGDFAAAQANYTKAISVWPWHPESHKNLAILYDLYMGKNQEALAHYEAYHQLVGDGDKNINSWIADMQRRLGSTPKPNAAPAPEAAVETDASAEAAEEEAPNE